MFEVHCSRSESAPRPNLMANGRFRRAQRGTTNQIVLLAASSGLSRRSNDMRRRASALTWMHSSASRLRSGRRIHRPRCPQSQLRGIVNVNHVSSDFEVTESSPGRLCRSIGRGALWRFCLKYLPKTDARIRSPILRRTSRVAHADNIRHPRVPPVHKNRRWKRSQSPPQADKGFAYPHRPKRMSTEAERSASVHSHWLRERADGGFEGKIAADARADLGLSEHAFHPSRKLRPTSWQP